MSENPRWRFSAERLVKSPSRTDGYDFEKELSYRQQAANFIKDVSERGLKLSLLTTNTAIVYMHRFYVFHSFKLFHRYSIAVASLFLAAKTEEQPRFLEHVIKTAHLFLNKEQLDVNSPTYKQLVDELLFNEQVLLKTLGFELSIEHPHKYILQLCSAVEANKELAHACWCMTSHMWHLTTMCLEHSARLVACASLYVSCEWMQHGSTLVTADGGKPWFKLVGGDVSMEQIHELKEEFINIIKTCPKLFKNKMMVSQKFKLPQEIVDRFNAIEEQEPTKQDTPRKTETCLKSKDAENVRKRKFSQISPDKSTKAREVIPSGHSVHKTEEQYYPRAASHETNITKKCNTSQLKERPNEFTSATPLEIPTTTQGSNKPMRINVTTSHRAKGDPNASMREEVQNVLLSRHPKPHLESKSAVLFNNQTKTNSYLTSSQSKPNPILLTSQPKQSPFPSSSQSKPSLLLSNQPKQSLGSSGNQPTPSPLLSSSQPKPSSLLSNQLQQCPSSSSQPKQNHFLSSNQAKQSLLLSNQPKHGPVLSNDQTKPSPSLSSSQHKPNPFLSVSHAKPSPYQSSSRPRPNSVSSSTQPKPSLFLVNQPKLFSSPSSNQPKANSLMSSNRQVELDPLLLKHQHPSSSKLNSQSMSKYTTLVEPPTTGNASKISHHNSHVKPVSNMQPGGDCSLKITIPRHRIEGLGEFKKHPEIAFGLGGDAGNKTLKRHPEIAFGSEQDSMNKHFKKHPEIVFGSGKETSKKHPEIVGPSRDTGKKTDYKNVNCSSISDSMTYKKHKPS